ncbi:integrase [Silvimonas terrae]|uniref:Integrase n=2 Tax=Silvimonas terrae TaxID=300266 RepID=A0A840RBC5_9NEIS|nr:integrase [Silvimonas terrae]
MWKGSRQWETLKMDPTPANLKNASKLRNEIKTLIAIGQFDYAAFFPDSKIAEEQRQAKSGPTFREVATRWMQANSHLASSTLDDYRKRLNHHVLPVIGDQLIRDIKYSDLAALLGNIEWGSMKSRNNTATVIRQPFDLAFIDGLIEVNPAARLRNVKSQKEPPDPFNLEEANLIIAKFREVSPQHANLFEFAFFTGMRTSELMGLCWEDIDWNLHLARVKRAKVGQEVKGTKTGNIRDVELNSRALAALQRQREQSYLRGKEVFTNPNTGEAYSFPQVLWKVWTQVMKKTGIRYRKPYQTRHTFATLNLMAGANPMWVSRQMGHTSMKMLLEVYSRWIDMADRSREKNKLESMLSVPNVCQIKTAQA